ncbi:MAG: hypothetical protein ACRC41_14305 [Sarcina sp.]
MCKKGLTLIECIVYLALISIASIIFLGGITSYKHRTDNLKKTSEIREIKKIFIETSFKCLQEDKLIQIEVAEDRIFIGRDKSFKLKELRIDTKSMQTKIFYINNKGLINEVVKIKFIGEGDEFVIENCKKCKKIHL